MPANITSPTESTHSRASSQHDGAQLTVIDIQALGQVAAARALGADGNAALIVAHPGHELRVHSWLTLRRPQVFVLTDGSGHGDHGRLESTARVLDSAEATRGSLFGQLSDRDAYQLILDRDLKRLQSLILELADQLVKAEVETVVNDAIEGFNPVHDLCFLIAEKAVQLASRNLGRPVQHHDFLLEAAPDDQPGPGQILKILLDESAWQRKLEAAMAYGKLRQEVERAIATHGSDAFRTEVLRAVDPAGDFSAPFSEPPSYESFGERRVADGIYDRVLRFREHFWPLAEDIRAWPAQT